MLVLSRKQQEQIKIGNDITVTVLEVHGNVVRIGIQAPNDVRILRGELPSWNEEPAAKAPRPRRRSQLLLAG